MSRGAISLIGNTPLIELSWASAQTGCRILGKAEFLNAGQSIKDRTALGIVHQARASGALRPGGAIVEGTAGNTGIGLAVIGAALGHPVTIVVPRSQSEEKKHAIRLHGATLIEVDPAPFANPNHFVHYARRLAEKLDAELPNGAYFADQFDNLANRQAHYEGTGREIWEQTGGALDAFICAVGSGGSLSGISAFLKERNPNIRIGIADPAGAALHAWFTRGVLEAEGSSIAEGIGITRITRNLDGVIVDHAYRIEDHEFLPVLFDTVQYEGLPLGPSSGVNIAGAMQLARDIGPGKTIVTLLCDPGQRYASKIYNPEFLRARHLPTPPWMDDA